MIESILKEPKPDFSDKWAFMPKVNFNKCEPKPTGKKQKRLMVTFNTYMEGSGKRLAEVERATGLKWRSCGCFMDNAAFDCIVDEDFEYPDNLGIDAYPHPPEEPPKRIHLMRAKNKLSYFTRLRNQIGLSEESKAGFDKEIAELRGKIALLELLKERESWTE